MAIRAGLLACGRDGFAILTTTGLPMALATVARWRLLIRLQLRGSAGFTPASQHAARIVQVVFRGYRRGMTGVKLRKAISPPIRLRSGQARRRGINVSEFQGCRVSKYEQTLFNAAILITLETLKP